MGFDSTSYRDNSGRDQWPPQGRDPRWQPQQWEPERRDPRDGWQEPPRRHAPPPPQQPAPRGSRMPLAMGACLVITVASVAVAAWAVLTRPQASSPAASTAAGAVGSAAQPETAAGVRAQATQFYSLYSAGQWAAAWAYLTPSAQAAVPEATFAAVHDGCPSSSDGLARVIKGVTVAGSTAVVTETIAGTLGSIGSVSDAWQYSGGQWRFSPAASSFAVYKHGSAAADIAAAKAAGDCKSS